MRSLYSRFMRKLPIFPFFVLTAASFGLTVGYPNRVFPNHGSKELESPAGGLLALPSEVTTGKNLILNPGFESGDSNWELSGCWSVDSSAAHSGSHSLRFNTGFCNPAPATTHVPYEHPGVHSFTLRAWVKASVGSDLQVRVALHDRTDRGYILAGTKFVSPGTDWQLLEKKDIDLPAIHDGHELEVTAVVHGSSGQAWFDDIEMVEQSAAPLSAFLLYPNFRGYLWSDGPRAIRVHVNAPGANPNENAVHLDLKSDAGVTLKTLSRPAEAAQDIELDGSRLALGSYQLEVRLTDVHSGRVIATYPPYRVTKVSDSFRKSLVNYIAPDNFLVRKGGKQFVWGVYDRFSGRFRCRERCLSSSAAAYEAIPGFDGKTTLDNYSDTRINAEINILPFVGVNLEEEQLRPWLQALDHHGVAHLQIVNTWINGSRGYPAWARGMSEEELWRRLVAAMKNEPGALGYYTYDEPQTEQIPIVFDQFKALREADPGSVNYGVLANCSQVFRWRDASDVLGCDPYSVGFPLNADDVAYGATSSPPMLRTSVMTRDAVRQVEGSRPVWMVLQLYRFNGRFPTYEQMKMQAYKAIINGANGIFWWGFVSEKGMEAEWNVQNNPQAYADFKRISDQVTSLEPFLIAPSHPELLTAVSKPNVETLIKMDGKKMLVFASNYGESPLGDVTITLAPAVVPSGASAEVYGEGRSVAIVRESGGKGPSIRDQFGPYEVHVYKLNLN
jgi:hypothetical protein